MLNIFLDIQGHKTQLELSYHGIFLTLCFINRYYKRDKEAKDAEGQLLGLQKDLADLEGKLAVSEQQRKHWEKEYNVC